MDEYEKKSLIDILREVENREEFSMYRQGEIKLGRVAKDAADEIERLDKEVATLKEKLRIEETPNLIDIFRKNFPDITVDAWGTADTNTIKIWSGDLVYCYYYAKNYWSLDCHPNTEKTHEFDNRTLRDI